MNRIPEPEIMDGLDQSLAYANADFEEVNTSIIERFMTCFPEAVQGDMVDLGCGPGDIPIRFCRQFDGLEIVAIDGSSAMIGLAEEALEESGVADRVRFVTGYIPDDLPPGRTFDAIFSNSLLHHLHDPSVIWKSVRALGSPGTAVFVMDLMRPDSREAAAELVETYSADEPEVLKVDFFNSLLAAFRPEEVEEQLERAGLSQLQCQVISDRHLLVTGRL
tara:strand:- start:1027 stop:1686 length:660 start_codon:yes stop_codon:yes gene_type:complete